MRCLPLLLISVAVLAVNGARAGEEDLLLMRGDAGDGGTRMNAFVAPERKPAAAARERSDTPGGYLLWKNSCAAPAGNGSSIPGEVRGFGQVQPYFERNAREERGYMELLVGELAEDS